MKFKAEFLKNKKVVFSDNVEKTTPKAEICILCGIDTKIDYDTPIERRRYYINGCGQLCRDCYNKLSGEKREESV